MMQVILIKNLYKLRPSLFLVRVLLFCFQVIWPSVLKLATLPVAVNLLLLHTRMALMQMQKKIAQNLN